MKHSPFRTMFTLLTVLLLATSFHAIADNHEGPAGNIAETWVVTVDMASQPAFEEAFKAHLAVRAEAGDPASWQTYTQHTGSNMSTYYVRYCCSSWADMDAYEAWGVENSNVSEDWNENVHPLVSSYGHHYSEVDFENSHWPDDTVAKFVGVTSYDIKPGSGQQFNAAMEELSQIALNEGWAEAGHTWAWSSAIDGSASVSLVIPHENYADMAAPDPTFFQFLTEHLGSEEAAGEIFQRFTTATEGNHYTLYRHRDDLSMRYGHQDDDATSD